KNESGRTPLMSACGQGQTGAAKLLLEHKADINRRDKQGWTALIEAAYLAQVGCARFLLAHGADASIKATLEGYEGKTAADIAQDSGYVEIHDLCKPAENLPRLEALGVAASDE